jgi:hypothetical protein
MRTRRAAPLWSVAPQRSHREKSVMAVALEAQVRLVEAAALAGDGLAAVNAAAVDGNLGGDFEPVALVPKRRAARRGPDENSKAGTLKHGGLRARGRAGAERQREQRNEAMHRKG